MSSSYIVRALFALIKLNNPPTTTYTHTTLCAHHHETAGGRGAKCE